MIERLRGTMLGASVDHFLHGQLTEQRTRQPARTHTFWTDGQLRWRNETSDGITMIDSDDGSATIVNGRLEELGPARHRSSHHIANQLLQPLNARIWGRPGDMWRLADDHQAVEVGGRELVEVALVGNEEETDGEPAGYARVDADTGWIWDLKTTQYRWRLTHLTADREVLATDHLFVLPPDQQPHLSSQPTAIEEEWAAEHRAAEFWSAHQETEDLHQRLAASGSVELALALLRRELGLTDRQARLMLSLQTRGQSDLTRKRIQDELTATYRRLSGDH